MPYNLEIPGQVDELQLKAIEIIAASIPKNGHIVEVGSLFGRTSWAWAKSVDPSVTVHCIDPWSGNAGVRPFEEVHGIRYSLEQFLEYTSDCDNIVAHQGYSPRDFINWDVAIDLYYEDAVHVDPTFSSNLDHWIAKLTPQGIVCGDDHRPRFPDIVAGVNRWSLALNRSVNKVSNFWCLLPNDASLGGRSRVRQELHALENVFHSGFEDVCACTLSLGVVDDPASNAVTFDVGITNSASAAWPHVDQYGLVRLRLSVWEDASLSGWRSIALAPLSSGVIIPDIVHSEHVKVSYAVLAAGSALFKAELLDWSGNVLAAETTDFAVPSITSWPWIDPGRVDTFGRGRLTVRELGSVAWGDAERAPKWTLDVPTSIKRELGQRTVVTVDLDGPLDPVPLESPSSTSYVLVSFIMEAAPETTGREDSSAELGISRSGELLECLSLEVHDSRVAFEAQIDLRAEFWPAGVRTVRFAVLQRDVTGGLRPVIAADVHVESEVGDGKSIEGSYRHPNLVEWLATGEPQHSWELGTFHRVAQHQYLFRTVAGDRMVSSMLSQYELGVLASYARVGYTGVGAIVDGGSLLGGSTLALAGGLAMNTSIPEGVKYGAIHAFDLWRQEGYSNFLGSGLAVTNGNLLPLFLNNVDAYSSWVRPYPGDFLSWQWGDEAIELLHLDHLKSEELNDHCVKTLFPRLVPGVGIVIQQDYIHFNEYWVHYTMEWLAEYFEPMGFYYGASGVFRLRKAIPSALIDEIPSQLPYGDKLLLLERARTRAPIQVRQVMKVAAAKCALDNHDGLTARALLDEVDFSAASEKDQWLPIQGILRSNFELVEGMLKRSGVWGL